MVSDRKRPKATENNRLPEEMGTDRKRPKTIDRPKKWDQPKATENYRLTEEMGLTESDRKL